MESQAKRRRRGTGTYIKRTRVGAGHARPPRVTRAQARHAWPVHVFRLPRASAARAVGGRRGLGEWLRVLHVLVEPRGPARPQVEQRLARGRTVILVRIPVERNRLA